jgi:hypothetical protein
MSPGGLNDFTTPPKLKIIGFLTPPSMEKGFWRRVEGDQKKL